MPGKLMTLLTHPLVRNFDIDAPETTVLRSLIVKKKSFLKQLYREWYISLSSSLPPNVRGPVLELGSGGGFLKDFVSDLITSEILQIPCVDVVLDAQRLPFRSASLRGIVMLDVFHHLPRVESFLSEAATCVKPDGVIVMIEPWNTPWSRLVFKYLHHEPFDTGAEEWSLPEEGGPLSQANSSLPWIVFDRDREVFEQKFPTWQIAGIRLHTPFRYLLSGGVSLRSLMPGCLFGMWRRLEDSIQPWMHSLGMFATITLVRRPS